MVMQVYIVSTWSKMIIEQGLKNRESKKLSSSLKDKHHGQASINTMLQAIHYSNESIKYNIITRNLVVFVGITNVANTFVELPEFKDLFKEIETH